MVLYLQGGRKMKPLYLKEFTNPSPKRKLGSNQYKAEYVNHWFLKLLVITVGVMVIIYVLCWFYERQPEPTFVSPIPESKVVVKQVMAVEPYLEGIATWYGTGIDECLGCNPKRIMANGKLLNDSALTVACGVGGSCRMFPLGSKVKIINLGNMMTVDAIVTDTGGFTKYNRVLDVTKLVRDSLNMEGMAKVRVSLIK
jgi:3D (Asp-Asp-Asp) domain-containing protein